MSQRPLLTDLPEFVNLAVDQERIYLVESDLPVDTLRRI